MAESPTVLTLRVDAGPAADLQDHAELTQRLRKQILDCDIDNVEFARSRSVPPGAKGDPITLTALIVTLAPAALTSLFGMLQTWLRRHERATVTVESGGEKLTLTGTLSAEQKQTVTEFLNRHHP